MLQFAPTLKSEFGWCLDHARAHRVRPIRQFAEEEIVLPEGPFAGQRFRIRRQPFAGLFFDAIDSGRWTKSATLGCVQSGKSLISWVIPSLWYLFEWREPMVGGVPTMETAEAKWSKELLPAIVKTRYAEYLPTHGRGSRGGMADEVIFTNGARLKFMHGHGGDEARSSYTARIAIVTEADKIDTAGEASREAPPIKQIEARTHSYDADQRRFHAECTVSVPTGYIWQAYTNGTRSRIVVQCLYCGHWVTPERAHLRGWQEAENAIEARQRAFFVCPKCEHAWTDAERRRMNQEAKLLHHGESIDTGGRISGEPPATDTFGMRWNAFNNLLWSTGAIGTAEWEGARAEDLDAAEKYVLQFYWAMPWTPPRYELVPLEWNTVRRRYGQWTKGIVPADAQALTLGMDLGKWIGWWVAMAWLADGRGHVVDYGSFPINTEHDDLVELAILEALREFRPRIEAGWTIDGSGVSRLPDRVFCDGNYKPKAVEAFCRESGPRYLVSHGYGIGQEHKKPYREPAKLGGTVVVIGEDYYVEWNPEEQCFEVHVLADAWKTQLYEGLQTSPEKAGAITLYQADGNEHKKIARHYTSEEMVEELHPERGVVKKWVHKRGANHWFDCSYNAKAAGHLCGVRVLPVPDLSPAIDATARPIVVSLPSYQ